MTQTQGVAVVIGAASGIGKALAQECVKRGYRVAIADLDEKGLQSFAADLPPETYFSALDVADPIAMQSFADQVIANYGEVEIVFNCAGVFAVSSVAEQSIEHFNWVMNINFGGVLHSAKAFLPHMGTTTRKSYMVSIASIMGLLTSPMVAAYSTSKHAVITLSEILNLECQKDQLNVQVSAVCTGAVDSNIYDMDRYGVHTDRSDQAQQALETISGTVNAKGMSPEEHAEIVFDQMLEGHFWILPHKELLPQVERRMSQVLNQKNPTLYSR